MRPHILLLSLALPALAQESRTASREEDRPYPVNVTEATRVDPKALAALEQPGKALFSDGFESPDALKAYFEVRGAEDGRARIDEGDAIAHSGRRALRLLAPAAGGKSSGSGVSYWFGPEGLDRVHLRYWLRFAADYDQGNLNHTGGCLSASTGTNKWEGMGKAGLRPNGDDRFSTRFEAWRDWGRNPPPGQLHLYTYWMDMKRDRDGNYWGNMFLPEAKARIVPERDRWSCYEVMVRAGTPGKADGELAAWLDGRLYLHEAGFRWRSSDAVRLKSFDLIAYIHQATRDNVVWYDDVVLSTGYVGKKQ